MRRLYHKTKWLHKIIGLTLILYCSWMGLSGVLVNHPEWIGEVSVPDWMVPDQYRLEDWNRGALISYVTSERDPESGWIAGSEGVWKTEDGGVTFRPLDDGFPTGPRERRTRSLLLVEDGPHAGVWAGTAAGLWWADMAGGAWREVPLGEDREEVRSVLAIDDRIVAVTKSRVWERRGEASDDATSATGAGNSGGGFRSVVLRRAEGDDGTGDPSTDRTAIEPKPTESLVTFFFDVHSGSILGLPGRLVMDVIGILIFLLSIPAFWLWLVGWRFRRAIRHGDQPPRRSRSSRRTFKIIYDTHIEIGIWIAPFFLLLAVTGFFMRPPLLAALVGRDVPAALFPLKDHSNPWEGRIHRAVADTAGERIVLETNEGLWEGPVDFSTPFRPFELALPIHVMGSSYLEVTAGGGFVAGSFSGAFRWEPGPHGRENGGGVVNLISGAETDPATVSRMRTADHMVTGRLRTPTGEEFLSTHRGGLVPLAGAKRGDRFEMPEEMTRRHRMSLWNWMFELHNSRLFRDAIGNFYLLIPPLGSLLFGVLTLVGVVDWFYMRVWRKRGKVVGEVGVDTSRTNPE